MIEYRSFLNTDPPAIVDLWKQQPRFRRLSSTVSRNDFDQLVFGKPYFDPAGFIVAVDQGRPCGFVHAGFGPNEDGSDLGFETGLLLQLRCLERADGAEIRRQLTARALQYLRGHGATICYAASRFPWVPYYLGLYGGSRIPGVPHEDETMMQALTAEGFETNDRILIFQLKLSGFRPRIDRNQMTVRRQYQISAIVDPQPTSWWDNCMYGMAETFAFRLADRRSELPAGSVSFWEIQPLSIEWGVRSMGMCDLQIHGGFRQSGLGTFLVGQALVQMQQQGVGICEVQVRESNQPAIRLFQKLGFEQVSHGLELLRKLD